MKDKIYKKRPPLEDYIKCIELHGLYDDFLLYLRRQFWRNQELKKKVRSQRRLARSFLTSRGISL